MSTSEPDRSVNQSQDKAGLGVRARAGPSQALFRVSAIAALGGLFFDGQAITKQATSFLFTGLAVLAFIFFQGRVPETNGASLERIRRELTDAHAD